MCCVWLSVVGCVLRVVYCCCRCAMLVVGCWWLVVVHCLLFVGVCRCLCWCLCFVVVVEVCCVLLLFALVLVRLVWLVVRRSLFVVVLVDCC